MPDLPGYSMRREGTEWSTVNNAKNVVEVLLGTAKDTILRDGSHSPMLFIITKDEVIVFLVWEFLKSDSGKDSLADLASKLIKRFDARGVALITEGWMVRSEDGIKPEELPYIRASQHPARIEVLQITSEWEDGSQFMRMLRMMRNNEGKVNRLIEFDRESGWEEIGGRFCGFFKQ